MNIRKIIRRSAIGAGLLCAALILIAATLWIIDALQQRQDHAVLRDFVAAEPALAILKDRAPVLTSSLCAPDATKRVGDCPALRYRISKEECLQLQKQPEKDFCGDRWTEQYKGRAVEMQLGGIYEKDAQEDRGLYAQIIMDETNLLWRAPLEIELAKPVRLLPY